MGVDNHPPYVVSSPIRGCHVIEVNRLYDIHVHV